MSPFISYDFSVRRNEPTYLLVKQLFVEPLFILLDSHVIASLIVVVVYYLSDTLKTTGITCSVYVLNKGHITGLLIYTDVMI